MKILDFFLFLWVFLPSWIRIRISNLNADPDPATQINADPDPDTDPDPKPWLEGLKFKLYSVYLFHPPTLDFVFLRILTGFLSEWYGLRRLYNSKDLKFLLILWFHQLLSTRNPCIFIWSIALTFFIPASF